MLQSRQQTGPQAAPQRRKGGNPSWVKGRSGNPEGARLVQQRRQDVEQSFLTELGDVELMVIDRERLKRACAALVRRTRDDNQAVRLLRVANETLRELRERYAKRAKPAPLDDVNAPLPI